MADTNNSNKASDPKVKKIVQKKKQGNLMRYFGYALIGLAVLLLLAARIFELDMPGIIYVLPIVAAAYFIFGGNSARRDAYNRQHELGIDKLPAEAEKKENEKIRELAALPEEMDKEFKKLALLNRISAKMFLLGLILLGVCAVVAIAGDVLGIEFSDTFIIVLACVTILLLFPGVIIFARVDNRQKKLALQYTPGALSEAMDRLDKYDPKGSVDQKYMWEDFSFGSRDRIGKCGDYVKGVLRGRPVEFCEFELQNEFDTTDDEGRRTTEVRTTFSGLMAVCRHGFRLSNDVTMTQFSRYFKEIKTESIEFTRAWSVREDSGVEAFRILTPQYMEKLMATVREKGMRMGLQFRADGVLLIVLKGADFFEVDEAKKVDELKEKIRKEIKDLGDILENVGALTENEEG